MRNEGKVQKASRIKEIDIVDENCTLPPPLLPKVDDDDTICNVAFVTRALWYTILDMGITTVAQWRGKVVTLAAIESYLSTLPAMLEVDTAADGEINIPF